METLQGKATYWGGATGYYTLGGGEDAGRFTARATLQADFGVNLSDAAI